MANLYSIQPFNTGRDVVKTEDGTTYQAWLRDGKKVYVTPGESQYIAEKSPVEGRVPVADVIKRRGGADFDLPLSRFNVQIINGTVNFNALAQNTPYTVNEESGWTDKSGQRANFATPPKEIHTNIVGGQRVVIREEEVFKARNYQPVYTLQKDLKPGDTLPQGADLERHQGYKRQGIIRTDLFPEFTKEVKDFTTAQNMWQSVTPTPVRRADIAAQIFTPEHPVPVAAPAPAPVTQAPPPPTRVIEELPVRPGAPEPTTAYGVSREVGNRYRFILEPKYKLTEPEQIERTLFDAARSILKDVKSGLITKTDDLNTIITAMEKLGGAGGDYGKVLRGVSADGRLTPADVTPAMEKTIDQIHSAAEKEIGARADAGTRWHEKGIKTEFHAAVRGHDGAFMPTTPLFAADSDSSLPGLSALTRVSLGGKPA